MPLGESVVEKKMELEGIEPPSFRRDRPDPRQVEDSLLCWFEQ